MTQMSEIYCFRTVCAKELKEKVAILFLWKREEGRAQEGLRKKSGGAEGSLQKRRRRRFPSGWGCKVCTTTLYTSSRDWAEPSPEGRGSPPGLEGGQIGTSTPNPQGVAPLIPPGLVARPWWLECGSAAPLKASTPIGDPSRRADGGRIRTPAGSTLAALGRSL